jgi:iron complex transport system ATP-binding protein
VVTIRCEGLSVDLGGRRVLDGVDLTLEAGALIGVIGPNGAGKSTLARAALGLVPAAAGRVLAGEEDVAHARPADLARRIAYLPQGRELHWPLSVERLVALGRLPHLAPFSRIGAADEAAIAAALAETGMTALRDRVATALSGGERARAMLARALATGAPALIADEPLAALDPGHQIEVMALLQRRARAGGLVVVVLHDLSIAARFCDRLVLLDRGRLVADGAPEAVLTDARLAEVYGISAWRGAADGRPLLVPLARID